MKSGVSLLLASILGLLVTGCAQNESSGNEMNYQETKKMVVDILKTDDGIKAIQEIMKDEAIRTQIIMDQKAVKDTIEKTMTSDKNKQFWQNAFKDPKFAAAYASSMKDQHQALLKDMMKDPEYRAMVMELMQDPEIQKEFSDLAKSTQMRKLTKETLIETMDSPLVRAKIQDILVQAAAQQQKK
ncbi:spore germination lipoprotein GerD [Peribacillus sp. SCS-155]|uniref:spore germination lipoprotein GerD n=1 Tax=Peribacillus sedimenti TaxID=3115297 RepID=UPI00390600DA